MATNTQWTSASPDQVWALLCDPRRYTDWVVGAEAVRDVEGDWPSPGARLHYRAAIGPFRLQDHTEVQACDAGRLLALQARGGHLGRADIRIELRPSRGDTVVSLTEEVRLPVVGWAARWLLDGPTWLRNVVSLRRLARAARSVG